MFIDTLNFIERYLLDSLPTQKVLFDYFHAQTLCTRTIFSLNIHKVCSSRLRQSKCVHSFQKVNVKSSRMRYVSNFARFFIASSLGPISSGSISVGSINKCNCSNYLNRVWKERERRKYFFGKHQTDGCFIPAETSMRMGQRGQGGLPRIVCGGDTLA